MIIDKVIAMSAWYYYSGGSEIGPVEFLELQALAIDGQLRPDDQVYREGMPKWLPARQFPGLFSGRVERPPQPRSAIDEQTSDPLEALAASVSRSTCGKTTADRKPRQNSMWLFGMLSIACVAAAAIWVTTRNEQSNSTLTPDPAVDKPLPGAAQEPVAASIDNTPEPAKVVYASAVKYLHGDGVPKDDARAVELLRQADQLGSVDAAETLGKVYFLGEGAEKNEAEGVKWFSKAAQGGNVEAMASLGSAYFVGHGVEQDDDKAAEWLRRAAELKNPEAMFGVARLYEEGRGVQQNVVEAINWYGRAAELGNRNAMFNLGVIYEHGNGVTLDVAAAKTWYERAAAAGDGQAITVVAALNASIRAALLRFAEASVLRNHEYSRASENALAYAKLGDLASSERETARMDEIFSDSDPNTLGMKVSEGVFGKCEKKDLVRAVDALLQDASVTDDEVKDQLRSIVADDQGANGTGTQLRQSAQ